MATNPGPFSEYLQKQLEQPQQQPRLTGYEGAMGNIANIATQFLQGIKQGRIQRFAQEQEEEEKNRGKLMAMADFVQKSPGLTPAAKQSITGDIYGQLFGLAGSVPETSKHTGHPLTDAFKGFFTNLTGGELKKQPKVDLSLITGSPAKEGQERTPGILERISLPESQTAYHKQKADQEVASYLQDMRNKGQVISKDVLNSDPNFIAITSKASNAIGEKYQPDLAGIPDTREQAQLGILQGQALADLIARRKVAKETPPVATPVAQPTTPSVPQPTQPIPVAASEPQPPGALQLPVFGSMASFMPQPPPAPEVPKPSTGTSLSDIRKKRIQIAQENQFLPDSAKGIAVSESAPDEYFNPKTGKTFSGVYVTSSPDIEDIGVYDADTNQKVPGAKKATTAQINQPTDEEKKNVYDLNIQTIRSLLKGEDANNFERSLKAAMKETSPIAAMDNVVARAQSLSLSIIQRQTAIAAANEKLNTNRIDKVNDHYKTFNNNKQVKDYLDFEGNIITNLQNYKLQENQPGMRGYSDLALLTAFAKSLDPGSVVRPSEFNNVKDIQDWYNNLKGDLKRVFSPLVPFIDTTTGTLSDENKKNILALMGNQLAAKREQLNRYIDIEAGNISRYDKQAGIDFSNQRYSRFPSMDAGYMSQFGVQLKGIAPTTPNKPVTTF
mgnify:CR=1 FL=1